MQGPRVSEALLCVYVCMSVVQMWVIAGARVRQNRL